MKSENQIRAAVLAAKLATWFQSERIEEPALIISMCVTMAISAHVTAGGKLSELRLAVQDIFDAFEKAMPPEREQKTCPVCGVRIGNIDATNEGGLCDPCRIKKNRII